MYSGSEKKSGFLFFRGGDFGILFSALLAFLFLGLTYPDPVGSSNRPVGLKASEIRRDPFQRPRFLEDIQKKHDSSLYWGNVERGRFITQFESGVKTVYTLDPTFQQVMKQFLSKNRVPYGAFVAMDPHTGKILAFTEHSSREPRAKRLALRATYPAASIFKVITASALVEEKGVQQDTLIVDFNRFNPIQTTMGKAFASSDNEAFGAMALRYLSFGTLAKYAARFQFNQKIPFDFPVDVSQIHLKRHGGSKELARLAAGFGDVGLSPLHAALIGSAIANEGRMIKPCIVDYVMDPSGKRVFECMPRVITQAISERTAAQLLEMMGGTITRGTGRRAFRAARGDPALQSVSIGGKTGSLNGKNPEGHVTWFIGMAPLENPQVVISTMVVNSLSGQWKVRAANVAQKGFSTYFKTIRPTRVAQWAGR